MVKVNLKSLIYKNYLKTALTSLIFIEIALILIYFNANEKMAQTSIDFILDDIKKSVQVNVQHATEDVNHKFEDIETMLSLVQHEQQNYFNHINLVNLDKELLFKTAPNGMYYKAKDNGGSSLVVSKNTKITPQVHQKIVNTEIFDASFKSVVDNNEMIIAAYFNSHDDINRYYPFIKNSFNAFPSDIHMENYNFYYEADAKHNPKRKVVWTDVYLDPAGQGWMLSAIVPIYKKNFLEGVTGFDVTIDVIIKNFLDFELPYDGSSFLIDKDGKVIAMTQEIAKLLGLKSFEKYIYAKNEKIDNTVHKKDVINILNHKNIQLSENIGKILNNQNYSNNINFDDKSYLMFSQKIDKTSWYIISLIDEHNIVAEVNELKNDYRQLGYIIVGLITIFYLIFFIYLYLRAKKFVAIINKPLSKIIHMTKDLGLKKELQQIEACGIEEIDALSHNFNTLSKELESRQNKLVESEIKRQQTENLANTDALTQVHNRRFLEDFSQKYLQIVKREKSDIALLIIDIDNFKTINDTYGHDHGDKIIIELVRILKDVIRENDLIVRYGGDEFVVLLPNTNIKNARKVATKLNQHINRTNELKAKEIQFTITIGCASNEKDATTIEQIIKEADIALYQAKSLGKNCVV